MRRISIKYTSLVIAMVGMLYSCSTPRHYNRSQISTDNLYGEVKKDASNMADANWKTLFNDSQLIALIEEGLTNNPDLQIATLKIEEAEAAFKQSRTSLLPGINGFGQESYTRNAETIYPTGPREVNTYQLGLEASWEVDVWGKLRTAKRAAFATMLATDAGQKAVKTRLISSIATSYYSLMALDAQLKITQQTVVNSTKLVETMKALKASGMVTGAAVVQSEASLYAAKVTIPTLEQSITETEHALSILIGRTPGKIERSELSEQQITAELKAGVPSQLLDNRPDVMQAEYAVVSAFEMTNNAKAYFYPSLSISATSGLVSDDLDNLLDPTAFMANIVGGLSAPIFNKRANRTRLQVAKAQQQEALITLRSTLLTAGAEVQNTLSLYESIDKQRAIRAKQLTALEKSVEFTKELLKYGSANYTEVLSAQQSLLSAQLGDVNDQLSQLSSVVTLYRALGGGWK